MREIKFRAWDKQKKKMIYTEPFSRLMPSNWKDFFELMMFTGSKDKNGKEIYEGDIIKDGLNELLTVEWEQKTASFIMVDEDMGYSFEDAEDLERLEVIGNIYENPELLNAD